MKLLVGEIEAKIFPISEVEKFRQHLFFPLYQHSQLQLECLGGLFLDLFDALNPAVVSIFSHHWLWRYIQNARNSGGKFYYRNLEPFCLYLNNQWSHGQTDDTDGFSASNWSKTNPPRWSDCRLEMLYKGVSLGGIFTCGIFDFFAGNSTTF